MTVVCIERMDENQDASVNMEEMVVRIKGNVLFNGKGAYAAEFEKVKKGKENVPVVLLFPNSPFKYPHPIMMMQVLVTEISKKDYKARCRQFLKQGFWRDQISYRLDERTLKDIMNRHAQAARHLNGKYYVVRYRKVCELHQFLISKPNQLSLRLKKHYQYDFICSFKSVPLLLKQLHEQVKRIEWSTKREFLCEYALLLQKPKEYFKLCSYFSGPCMWWCFKEEYLCKKATEFYQHVHDNLKVLDQFLYYGSPFTDGVVYDKRIEECMDLWQYVKNGVVKSRLDVCLRVYKSFLEQRNTNGNWLIDRTDCTTLKDVPEHVITKYFTKAYSFRQPVLVELYPTLYSFYEEHVVEKELVHHLQANYTVLLDQQLSKDFKEQVRRGTVLLEYPNRCIEDRLSMFLLDACKQETPVSYNRKVLVRALKESNHRHQHVSVCFVLCDYFSLSLLNRLFGEWRHALKFFLLVLEPLQFVSARDLLPNWRREVNDWQNIGTIDEVNSTNVKLFNEVPDGTQFRLGNAKKVEELTSYASGIEFMRTVDLDTSYVLVPNKGLKKSIEGILRGKTLYYGYTLNRKGKKPIFYEDGYSEGSLLRSFEEKPRLFSVTKGSKRIEKHNLVVTIATVAEVAIFGQRETVYLIGGDWEDSALKAAEALASERVYRLKLPNPDSVWNFKPHGKKKGSSARNRSAMHWLTVQGMKDELVEKEKKEAQDELRRTEKENDRKSHLKRKSRELYNDKNPNNKVRIL